jgi:hypothetical protein
MTAQTLLRPLSGETYIQFADETQSVVSLTYNDLWILIVPYIATAPVSRLHYTL